MTAAEERINKLFDELVPNTGRADTVAGEIVRAVSRIGYRNYNDGDHIGVDYGNETCNPAARYLIENAGEEVKEAVLSMWGVCSDSDYDALMEELNIKVLAYLDAHPELKTWPNVKDMWDYFKPDEDRDYGEDEEDEEW